MTCVSQTQDVAAPDGRDTRWNQHRAERRARILDAAVRAIDEQGGAVGVATFADEAGIPRSVVYKLFRNREDLDEQIRARIIEDMTLAMAPVLVPRGSLREMIRVGVETYVGWVSAHANLHRFLGAGSETRPTHGSRVITGGKTAFAQSLKEVAEGLLPMVLDGKVPPRGATENLAYALIGLTDSVVNRWLLAGRGRSSKKDLARFLTDAACGVVQGAARLVDVELDVDAPIVR